MDSPPRSHMPLHNPSPTLPSESKQAFLSPSQIAKQRWKILSFILISTLMYFFARCSLLKILQDNSLLSYDSQPRKYVSFAPIICGMIVYHFGATKAYQFIAAASAFVAAPALVLLAGAEIRHGEFFTLGEAIFDGSYLGLFVAHMSMIAKHFREKELSLAMGALYLSPILSGICFSGSFRSKSVSQSERLPIVCLIGISCLLGMITMFILAKLDKKAQDEGVVVQQTRPSVIQDLKSIKPITLILMGGIFLFSSTNYDTIIFEMRYRYFHQDDKHSQAWISVFSISAFVGCAACILFALLADKKGKRITIMLLSFLMILLGLIMLILNENSQNLKFIFLIYAIEYVAHYSFYACSWACLSLSVPQRVTGIIFGLAACAVDLKLKNSTILRECTIVCILGIIIMIAGLVVNKKSGANLDSCSMIVDDDGKVTDAVSFTAVNVDSSVDTTIS